MDSDILSYVVWGVLLAGVILWSLFAYLRRRRRADQMQLMELLNQFFRGDVPANELRPRADKMANRHFLQSSEFYALAVAAFQRAVDAARSRGVQFEQVERDLLSSLAMVKNAFGLPDLYQIEGWRAGRE
jgi:hypothetical protein